MPAFSSPSTWDLRYSNGSLILGPGLTVSTEGKVLVSSSAGGTVTAVTAGTGLTGGTISSSGTISLRPPAAGRIGGVKAGGNIQIAADGTISAVLPGGIGTVTGVFGGVGLSGGGVTGGVTLNLDQASTTAFGGVVVGPTLRVVSGVINAPTGTISTIGQVRLATNAETITGALSTVAVTPQGLANKVATTGSFGITILSNSFSSPSTTQAATSAAVKVAYDAAIVAQTSVAAALPLSGGTMTGAITFAPSQTFSGVGLPVATSTSPGVVIPGSGLSISVGGLLTTVNNGTVKSVTSGIGLGSPATGNTITSTGTINLLPATSTTLGGVKPGLNLSVALDGTLNVGDVLLTNRPYAYNSYVWPLEVTPGQAPGSNGNYLQLVNNVTGEVAWSNAGMGVTSVTAGTGLNTGFTGIIPNANPIVSTGTVNLADTTVVAGAYGVTGVLPTFVVDQQGRLTSAGTAFPFSPFMLVPQTAAIIQMDFATNNTHWETTLTANATVANPLNVVSGMRGSLIIRQDPVTPRALTWGSAWQFAFNEPGSITGVAGAVDIFDWVAYSGAYIVVTAVARNLGPAGTTVQPTPTLVVFDDIGGTFTGTATTFPLRVGGVLTTPTPTTNILVFLDGVQQKPGVQFTVVGPSIIFTAPPAAGTEFNAYTVV